MLMKIRLLIILLILNNSVIADISNYGSSKEKVNQSDINWLLDRHNIQEARGGTTSGLEPKIDKSPSNYFVKLQIQIRKKKKIGLPYCQWLGTTEQILSSLKYLAVTQIIILIIPISLGEQKQSWLFKIVKTLFHFNIFS